jgi:benzoate/toluate 1,2-dioxygenase beta subunit
MADEAKERADTSRFSYYVDEAFYARLARIAAEWSAPGDELPEASAEAACTRLLFREARLIDDRRHEDWLGLFTRECLYWIPAVPDGGDPRREVSLEFHDRRRLEDRIARLRTGRAYSQIPPTRTRHLLTNLEMWRVDAGEVRVRANVLIQTFQHDVHRALAGWCGWVLVPEDGSWKIAVKQVNLIDSDRGQENNTFVL